jgi:transcriptional regulator with PAS, ATPase and Fis domain
LVLSNFVLRYLCCRENNVSLLATKDYSFLQSHEYLENPANSVTCSKNKAEETLQELIDTITDGFALYDPADRLVLYNKAYKNFYAASAEAIHKGAKFEDILRFGIVRGQYPEAGGTSDSREAWISKRLKTHKSPTGTVLQKTSDNRWLLIRERLTTSGYIIGLRSDVTHMKNVEEQLKRQEAEARRLANVASRTNNLVIVISTSGDITWSMIASSKERAILMRMFMVYPLSAISSFTMMMLKGRKFIEQASIRSFISG